MRLVRFSFFPRRASTSRGSLPGFLLVRDYFFSFFLDVIPSLVFFSDSIFGPLRQFAGC